MDFAGLPILIPLKKFLHVSMSVSALAPLNASTVNIAKPYAVLGKMVFLHKDGTCRSCHPD